MIAGRAIFGIGGETIYSIQACICAKWFANMELTFAMGVSQSFPCMICFFGGYLVPYIYNVGGKEDGGLAKAL